MKTREELRTLAIQQYEKFELETQVKRKQKRFLQVEALLQTLIRPEGQAVDYYLWGLLYYAWDSIPRALEKFQASLQLNPGYSMARLYAGHCYFDLQQWPEALQAFLKVDQVALLSEFPLWRVVKLQELISVCYYRLQQEALGQEQLRQVLQAYQQYPYQELARPTEMMQVLAELGEAMTLRQLHVLIQEP